MKFAYDIPGYVQGHRFSQDKRYYDSANTRFNDLAGYNRFGSYVEKVNGSATFSNHGTNSREGLLLDNTNHWKFVNAIPWEGTMLMVVKPVYASGATMNIYPWIFGDSGTISANPNIRQAFFSGSRSMNLATASSALTTSITGITSGNIMLMAFSVSQSDRKARRTQDGTTVTASSALAGTTNGNGVAMGSSLRVRLGNLSGTAGDTTQNTTDYLYVFEQHFWKGDQLTDNLAAMKEFIDSLKSYYGIA